MAARPADGCMRARSGAKPVGHNADTVRLTSTDSRYRQFSVHCSRRAVPNARASAIAAQSVLIFLGTAIGPVVAIRLGYATLCVAVAAAVAVAALAVAVVLPAGASRIWRAWRRGGWFASRRGRRWAAALGAVSLGAALLVWGVPRDCGPACHGSAGVATAQADLDAPPHDRPPAGRRDAVGAGGTAGASTPPTTHRPATPAAQIPVGTRRDATTSRSSAEGSIVSTTRPVASPATRGAGKKRATKCHLAQGM